MTSMLLPTTPNGSSSELFNASTPPKTSYPRSPLQDRSNFLITPFGMSPVSKVAVAAKAQAKSTLDDPKILEEYEEDDGYASAQSEDVDAVLNGTWKPNYDFLSEVAGNSSQNHCESFSVPLDPILLPQPSASFTSSEFSFMQPTAAPVMTETAPAVVAPLDQSAPLKYTEADFETFKAQITSQLQLEYQQKMDKQLREQQDKINNLEKSNTEMQQKQQEMLSLIEEYENTVNALEAANNSMDKTSMEVYAKQLSELELTNTRLRTERQEIEASFQQMLKRYEQLKTLQSNAIKNEAILKNAMAKSQADLMSSEARFNRLKTHAQQQLDAANAEITRIRDESIKKSLLLAAKLSLCQTQMHSLETEYSLVQTENTTLKSVVEDLCKSIGKM